MAERPWKFEFSRPHQLLFPYSKPCHSSPKGESHDRSEPDVVLGEGIRVAGEAQRRVYGGGIGLVLLCALTFGIVAALGPWVGLWLRPLVGSWSDLIALLFLIGAGIGAIAMYGQSSSAGISQEIEEPRVAGNDCDAFRLRRPWPFRRYRTDVAQPAVERGPTGRSRPRLLASAGRYDDLGDSQARIRERRRRASLCRTCENPNFRTRAEAFCF